jgi:hypothetical protein
MSDDELQREVLDQVGLDRRTFVKRLLLGTAFAVPVIASFPLSAMGAGGGTCANQPPDGTCANQPFRNTGQAVRNGAAGEGGERGQTLGGAARSGNPPGQFFNPGQGQ